MLLVDERMTGPQGTRHAHASLCSECGTFVVWINGEKLTFQLVSDEQLAAAARYAEVLAKTEDAEPVSPLIITDGPIHHWFELTYAQYLTIPRSVLQSMPDEWQDRFVRCLEELDATIDWRPPEGRYWVQLKDRKGRYIHDPLMDYERGRRRVESKP